MPVLKLNIRRNRSKQVVRYSDTSPSSKSHEAKKATLKSKKSIFHNCQENNKSAPRECSHSEVINASFDTTDDAQSSSVPTAKEGLSDMWGINMSTNLDDLRRNFTSDKPGNSRSTRTVTEFKSKFNTDVIELKDPETLKPKNRSSWVSSSFNADCEFDSEEELDASIYTLLDEEEECQFRKLSLHDVLMEEELSFRKSLLWNDEDRSTKSN